MIIIGGSSGTLGELAIAFDEGKLIGVLTGTGGISDIAEDILAACNKETGAQVIYNDNPHDLVEQLLGEYHSEHYKRPSVFCRETGETSVTPVDGSQQDIVCGMWVAPGAVAARRTVQKKRYVFCSLQCAEKFDSAPDEYEPVLKPC